MTVQEFYPIFLKYPEICTDSRRSGSDKLFFALSGERFDGNSFAFDALNKGCAYAVVDDPDLQADDRLIRVADVLEFLQQLAHYHREQFDIPVIALTGTNGKTTTKELIAEVLGLDYLLLSTEGNLNNHIGVPLTLLRLRSKHEMALVEMGANHIGEIHHLCTIACPTHGLITNIGRAHLEGFGTFDGVIRAKSELYDYLKSHQGVVFVHEADQLLLKQLGDYPGIPYGQSVPGAPLFQLTPGFQLTFQTDLHPVGRRENRIAQTHLVGSYNLPNVLAALFVGAHFGVDWGSAIQAVVDYQPDNNRSQLKATDHNLLFLDAYNANPSSMILALEVFSSMEADHKLAILGDMLEMGSFAKSAHREILELVLQTGIETILVGSEFSALAGDYALPAYRSVDDLLREFEQHPIRKRSILLKGSRGNQLEKLVPLL